MKNLQGDIIGILDSGGNTVVEYLYNAWGQEVGRGGTMWQTLGALNPFRYRGYYFDQESGLYYLNSRYYDPEIGRYVNSDKYLESGHVVLGNNLFLYCFNNPVRYTDPSGEFVVTATAVTAVALLVGVFVITVVAAVAIQYAMQELLEYVWTQGNTALQIPKEQEIPDNVVPFPQQPKKPNKVSPPLSDPIPAPKPKDEDPKKGKYYKANRVYANPDVATHVYMSPVLDFKTAYSKVMGGEDVWTPNRGDALKLAQAIDPSITFQDGKSDILKYQDQKYYGTGHYNPKRPGIIDGPSNSVHIFYGYVRVLIT